ncbi:MAG: hypothetical protein V3V13_06265 [Paracoccaceae bacterium]
MNELNTLEDRLKSATDRISVLISAKSGGGAETPEMLTENAQLKEQLQKHKAERQADMDDLDALLAQLRPLMEDAENA